MSEDRKCCPLELIETELAIIIILLSVFLFKCCADNDNDDHCKKDKKDKKDNKDCNNNKSW